MSTGKACRNLPQALLLSSALFLILAGAPARAEVRKFTISDVMCKDLACEPMDSQAGLTTLEIEGEDFQEWAGNNLVFRVYRLVDRNRGDVVIDSRVDVSRKGHLETTIPVYDLTDGNYYLALYSAGTPGKPVAAGIFTRTTAATASRGDSEESPRPAPAPDHKSK